MHELLCRADYSDASPENTDAILLDGMALLQMLKDIPETFGDLAERVVLIIISSAKKAQEGLSTSMKLMNNWDRVCVMH